MKECMAHVEEINNYLKMFPSYQPGMELQNDKLLDIHEVGVPVLWQKQFLLQNWRILNTILNKSFASFASDLKQPKT
jgi:hypothetical protein